MSIRSTATTIALGVDWAPDAPPPGTTATPVPLRTHDGAAVLGVLHTAGRSTTVACLMHPRENFSAHYLVPPLLRAGLAVWTQTSRSVGSDLRLEHEFAVLDAAAGLDHLRSRGFDRIVLVGNSGGAGLYALYVEQAGLEPARRLQATPAGRPCGLGEARLPGVDALVLLAPHPGQGRLLLDCIDPSVVDEADPLSVDPTLDAFDPANGYRPEPGRSRFGDEFVQRYREAQRARVAAIDARARWAVQARRRARADGSDTMRRRAAHGDVFLVWRTDADLRGLDASIDPSDRAPGSLWGRDMLVSNYGAVGFARVCTPESWLSTWSGLTSTAALMRTLPSVRCPALVVEYTGDQATFPTEIAAMVDALGSPHKRHVRVRGDHHGRPLAPDETPGRALAAAAIRDWFFEIGIAKESA